MFYYRRIKEVQKPVHSHGSLSRRENNKKIPHNLLKPFEYIDQASWYTERITVPTAFY